MKTAAAMLLTLGLAACGGSYMNTKNAEPPIPIPDKDEADWRLYGQLPDFDTKVDFNSIETDDADGYNDPLVYVWVLREFKSDQTPDFKDEDDYRKEYSRFAINCTKAEMAGVAVERHDKDDDETSRRDVPGFQWTFEPTGSDNYKADFVRQVCGLAKQKEEAAESKKG
ncbi:surface-adhesin E family protein [Chitinimonas sp. PSY-7]|uniref:surface-adhesin E family protein n=1 Tax=Chitinimonas sp. PSY-7 TaxID=3459088 RepID=UPI00403FFD73